MNKHTDQWLQTVTDEELKGFVPQIDFGNMMQLGEAVMRWSIANDYACGIPLWDYDAATKERTVVTFPKYLGIEWWDVKDTDLKKTMGDSNFYPNLNQVRPYAQTVMRWATRTKNFACGVPTWEVNDVYQTRGCMAFPKDLGIGWQDVPAATLIATEPAGDLTDPLRLTAKVMNWAREKGYFAALPTWEINPQNHNHGVVFFPQSVKGKVHTKIEINNGTTRAMNLYTVGPDGVEKRMRGLLPYVAHVESSLVDTTWVVRDADTNLKLASAVTGKDPLSVPITEHHFTPLRTKDALQVTFNNKMPFDVDLYETSAEGKKVKKATLSRNGSTSVSTSKYASWDACQKGLKKTLIQYVPKQQNQVFDIQLFSVAGAPQDTVGIVNRTSLTLKLSWIDFAHQEKLIKQLKPGDWWEELTGVGHTWVARDTYSGRIVSIFTVLPDQFHHIEIDSRNPYFGIDMPVGTGHSVTVKNDSAFDIEVDAVGMDARRTGRKILDVAAKSSKVQDSVTTPLRVRLKGTGHEVALFIPNGDAAQTFTFTNDHAVRKSARPNNRLLEGEVALYSQADYKGEMWIVETDIADFSKLPNLDNAVSSIKVAPNTEATLYQDANYGNAMGSFYIERGQIPGGQDKRSSSIKIERLMSNSINLIIGSRSTLSEDYKINPSKSPGQRATEFVNFRTVISVPHNVREAQLFANQEVQIRCQGKSYTIDPVKPAVLLPNQFSKLLIDVESDSYHVPALKLRTNTMRPDEQLYIMPDVDLHHKLASMKPDALYNARHQLGIKEPKKYTRESYLNAQSGLQNLARTIQYTYNSTHYGVHHDRIVAAENMEHPHWILDFNAGDNQITYKPLTQEQVARHVAGSKQVSPTVGQSFWDDLKEFGSIIIHRAKKIGGHIVHAVESGIKHIKQTLHKVGEDLKNGQIASAVKDFGSGLLDVGGDILHGGENVGKELVGGAKDVLVLTIKTAEEAFQFILDHTGKVGELIKKIFDKIGAATKKVLTWLMDALGWDDIVKSHKVVEQFITNGLRQAKRDVNKLKSDLDKAFRGGETTVTRTLNQEIRSLAPQHFAKQTSPHYHYSKAVSVVEWLLSEFADGYTASKMMNLPESNEYSALFSQLEKKVMANRAVRQDFERGLEDLVDSFDDPSQAPELMLSALLEVAKGTMVGGMTIVNEVMDELLVGLEGMATALEKREITIPFISELYSEFVTHSPHKPMTLVGFVSLLISIPLTILYKADNGQIAFEHDIVGLAQNVSLRQAAQKGALEGYEAQDAKWTTLVGILYSMLHLPAFAIFSGGHKSYKAVAAFRKGKKTGYIYEAPKVEPPDLIFDGICLALSVGEQFCGNPEGLPGKAQLAKQAWDYDQNDPLDAPGFWSHLTWGFQWFTVLTGGLDFILSSVDLANNGLGTGASTVSKYVPLVNTAAGCVHIGLFGTLAAMEVKKRNTLADRLQADDYTTFSTDKVEKFSNSHRAQMIGFLQRVEAPKAADLAAWTATKQKESLHDLQIAVVKTLNYYRWASMSDPNQIALKTSGNLFDALVPACDWLYYENLMVESEGISAIVGAVADIVCNTMQGLIYYERTRNHALL